MIIISEKKVTVVITIIGILSTFAVSGYYHDKAMDENRVIIQELDQIKMYYLERDNEILKNQIKEDISNDITVEINPNYSYMTWYGKGNILTYEGKYEEALVCYDKAIEINSNHDMTWYGKGVSLAYLGRHEEALVCYDKAIEINSNNYMVWYGKGVSLAWLGRNDEALVYYKQAKEINPNLDILWYN